MKHRSIQQKQIEKLNTIFSFAGAGSFIFVLIGFNGIENYKDWLLYSCLTALAGMVLGIFIYFLICSALPRAWSYKNAKGSGLLAPLVFSLSLIFFGTGRLVNESYSFNNECGNYRIEDISSSGRAYYVFIETEEGRERLNFGKAYKEMHKKGDTIKLCLVRGALGARYYRINE